LIINLIPPRSPADQSVFYSAQSGSGTDSITIAWTNPCSFAIPTYTVNSQPATSASSTQYATGTVNYGAISVTVIMPTSNMIMTWDVLDGCYNNGIAGIGAGYTYCWLENPNGASCVMTFYYCRIPPTPSKFPCFNSHKDLEIINLYFFFFEFNSIK